jgi:hypothetical protein
MNKVALMFLVLIVGYCFYWIYKNIFFGQLLPMILILVMVACGFIYYKIMVEQ